MAVWMGRECERVSSRFLWVWIVAWGEGRNRKGRGGCGGCAELYREYPSIEKVSLGGGYEGSEDQVMGTREFG